MEFLEEYYSEMKDDPEFRLVVEAWRIPSGRMGEMKYAVPDVMLASGRDDTSLLNALLNGFVMGMAVAAALANKDVRDLTAADISFAKVVARISICGDDTLGFLPNDLWPRRVQIMRSIEDTIKLFGLVPKLDCSNYLGQAVYLGMRPYNIPFGTGRKWMWGRTIGRAAYKMGWMLDLAKGDPSAWMTGNADAIVRTQPYVPILSDLARKIVELREGCKRTPVKAD